MKNKIIWLALAAVILTGAFIALKPESSKAPSPSSSTQQNQTKSFAFEIKDGQLVSGKETIKVNEGDKVKLTVTSDHADELHLHGYNKEVELEANTPSSIEFDATLTGRFELELHHTEKVIAAIEVQPKP